MHIPIVRQGPKFRVRSGLRVGTMTGPRMGQASWTTHSTWLCRHISSTFSVKSSLNRFYDRLNGLS